MAAVVGLLLHPVIVSKTKQDRQTHASIILFKLSPGAPLGRYSDFKICVNINTASCLTWRQRQLLSTECDARDLLITIVALCIDDAEVEQETEQLLFAVRYCC